MNALDPQTGAAPEDESKLRVDFEVFDGPLDLLLSLVKERRLDIATIPLASVAEQYLTYVSMMEDLNVEIAAEYLVIAATLVFLKSKALLPPIPAEFSGDDSETPEQVEERLRQRLIAYSKYREVGEDLRTRQLEAASFFYRDSGDPVSELRQRYRVDAEKLDARVHTDVKKRAPGETNDCARTALFGCLDGLHHAPHP